MHLTFSPVRSDTPLTLQRQGDTLIVNGVPFDFGPIPEGGILPQDAVSGTWLASGVTRQDGRLRLTLFLPHGARAPEITLFPADIVDPGDGTIPLPPFELEA